MKSPLILTILILATSAYAWGSDAEVQPLAPNLARIILRMIDAHGEIQSGGHVTRMEWVWSKATPTDVMDSPALRVWLETQLPEDWQVEKISGTAVTVAQGFGAGPIGKTQTFAVDLRARNGSLRMIFRDHRNRMSENTLAIQLNVGRPYVIIRPECTAQHVHLLANKVEARHLFVGLSCVDTGDGVDVYFFRSNESKWDNQTPGLVRFDPEGKYIAFKQHFGKPHLEIKTPRGLFQVGTIDDQGRGTDYSVFFQSNTSLPRHLELYAGAALVRCHLNEKSHDVALTQYAFNVRVGAKYPLIPDTLFASLDFNGDVVALEHGPRDVPQAHFFGLDGLIGYRLPLGLEFVDLTIYGGWYYWAVHVATNRYGIGPLGGPEGFLTLGKIKDGSRGWQIWMKYATIGDHGQLLSTFDHELGIGALLELSEHSTRPFALTAEFKNAHAVSQPNQIELTAISLGIRKEF
ncbi:MAG: hypothetical protein HY074_19975 [Deltaproteobacteria bacterium]|nr:hypothetical protein [Deltaproteobacteria bacterium]